LIRENLDLIRVFRESWGGKQQKLVENKAVVLTMAKFV
jgi:hypothetical protein